MYALKKEQDGKELDWERGKGLQSSRRQFEIELNVLLR